MKNSYDVRGDVVVLHLKYGDSTLETTIDAADLPKAASFPGCWSAERSKSTGAIYCAGTLGKSRVKLHRFLTDAPAGMDVDHIDHDTLHNRQANLRFLTRADNLLNRKGPQSNNSHGHLGVKFHKRCPNRPWNARLRGKSLGYYATPEEAAAVVAKARAAALGEG